MSLVKILLFLTTLFLTSCVTMGDSDTKYHSGSCVAFDNDKLRDDQYADPNTEVYIISVHTRDEEPELRFDYYLIEFTDRDTKEEVETGVHMERFNYITYAVVCGSCCPPGNICVQGCRKLDEK